MQGFNSKLAPKKCTTPISTIYYGTEEHLTEIMRQIRITSPQVRYAYIFHKADTDDTKDHCHLLLRTLSSCFNNVDNIKSYFKHENDESFYIRPFVQTKENALYDWYKYAQHDAEYLRTKGLERNVNYSQDDVKGDEDLLTLLQDCQEFKSTVVEQTDLEIIKRGIENGLNDWQILGMLPNVKADNLNAILCGIKRMREAVDFITPEIKNQIVEEYLHDIGLYDGVKRLLSFVNVKGRKNGLPTRSDVERFLHIAIEQSFTTDQLEYILDGKISSVF